MHRKNFTRSFDFQEISYFLRILGLYSKTFCQLSMLWCCTMVIFGACSSFFIDQLLQAKKKNNNLVLRNGITSSSVKGVLVLQFIVL